MVTNAQQHSYPFGHPHASHGDAHGSPPGRSVGICHADDTCLVGILNIAFGFSYGDENILCIVTVKEKGEGGGHKILTIFLKFLGHMHIIVKVMISPFDPSKYNRWITFFSSKTSKCFCFFFSEKRKHTRKEVRKYKLYNLEGILELEKNCLGSTQILCWSLSRCPVRCSGIILSMWHFHHIHRLQNFISM